MRRCASASPFPIEARFSMQPFTLRQRGPVLRPVPATGSTLPAYIFEAIPSPTPQPVRFQTPVPAQPFCCLAGYDPRLKPVARVELQDFPPVFEPPLPSRTFRSFGIKALSPTPIGNACLCESPDLPSLPVSRKLLPSPRDGSSFQIRYFPPSSLFLEPLGTIYIMHPGPRRRQYENCVSNREHLLRKQGLTRVSLWRRCE